MSSIVDMHGEIRTRARLMTSTNTWQSVEGYGRVFGGRHSGGEEAADFSQDDLAELAALDVAFSVLHAKQPSRISGSWDDQRINDELLETLSLSDRLLGFYALDFNKDVRAEIARVSENPRILGGKLNAVWYGARSDDERFYPFYEEASKRGQVVWVHSGNNWDDRVPMDLTHPSRIDRIAADFPELSIIIGHGGWPWILEACVVAWRHPNVYLDLSAHRPRHFSKPGTGWDPLFGLGARPARDKILFGSAWELVGVSLSTFLEEFRSLPVDDETMIRWTSRNALRLLGKHGFHAGA